MGKTNKIFLIFSVLFLISFISAFPGFPHKFYGDVKVNSVAAPDNNIITATVDGENYMTVTKDGKYGMAPNAFYIEDPFGDRTGKTINFYMDGLKVGSAIFENSGYTKLDFNATTTCGDSYCIGSETCGSCSTDCGVCTAAPLITISSPENKIYDTNKINLDVSSDQPIIIWLYSLNGEGLKTFSPSIIMTAKEGVNNVTVVGINNVFQTGQNSVSFTVELPPPSSSGSGGGGSSSSSSGGGSSSSSSSSGGIPNIKNLNNKNGENNAQVGLGIEKSPDQNNPAGNNGQIQTTSKGFFSSITGAFSSVGNQIGGYKSVAVITVILGIIVLVFVIYRKKSKTSSENHFIKTE